MAALENGGPDDFTNYQQRMEAAWGRSTSAGGSSTTGRLPQGRRDRAEVVGQPHLPRFPAELAVQEGPEPLAPSAASSIPAMRQSRILFRRDGQRRHAHLGAPVPAHADLVVNKAHRIHVTVGQRRLHDRCGLRPLRHPAAGLEPPPRPADCRRSPVTGRASRSPRLPAEFVCAGDTALAGGPALEYGESVSGGPIRCTSSPSGMTCRRASVGTDSRSPGRAIRSTERPRPRCRTSSTTTRRRSRR